MALSVDGLPITAAQRQSAAEMIVDDIALHDGHRVGMIGRYKTTALETFKLILTVYSSTEGYTTMRAHRTQPSSEGSSPCEHETWSC